jgi:Signal transduction histidine kinase
MAGSVAVSRLRLRLAAWFGLAFLVTSVAMDGGLYVWLERGAEERLTASLEQAGREVAAAVRREEHEDDAGLAESAAEVLGEWPGGPQVIAVYGLHGQRLRAREAARYVALAPDMAPSRSTPWEATTTSGDTARLVAVEGDGVTVVAGRSTAELRAFRDNLLRWMAASIPAAVLLALMAGYLLAGRSLRPVREISRAIREMDPDDLERRLPVRDPPDELDALAGQFNGLLARLSEVRTRNRRFVSRAAHQIRTPLTVARGEASLGLEGQRPVEAYRAALGRILAATEQMSRRVEDLFLLAEAETGGRPPVDDEVELDGLALDCTDFMRGRATRTRHPLSLDRVEPATARGNARLLREALTELLENALRHASPGTPVLVSAWRDGPRAVVDVVSQGAPVPREALAGERPPGGGELQGDRRGLGLSIVRWIAGVHAGRLEVAHADGANTFRLTWPA